MAVRHAPIGAEPGEGGTHFRVWAPAHEVLDVVLLEPSAADVPDALVGFTPRGCIAQAWSVAELIRAAASVG